MAPITTVAVVGGSGGVGEGVLPQLLKTNLQITAVSRAESKAKYPAGVRVVAASPDDPASYERAFRGQDAVVSLVGGPGLINEAVIVEAAAKAGVRYFVPSGFGYDFHDPKVGGLLWIFASKLQVDGLLRKYADRMAYTWVVVGLFLEWGFKMKSFDIDFQTKTAKFWDDGSQVFAVTSVYDIGTAVATLLTNEEVREKSLNQRVYITSINLNQKNILAAAEKVTGEKWTVKTIDGKKEFEEAKKRAEATKNPVDTLTALKGLSLTKGDWEDWKLKAIAGNSELLPTGPGETLEETVRRFIREEGL